MSASVNLIELTTWKDALTAEVRDRARNGSATELTRKYSAQEDGAEVGYVALDWWPHDTRNFLVLYEVFVPVHLRHNGVGTKILGEVEKIAKDNGYSTVRLSARPLENYPQPQLATWYASLGYTSANDGPPDEMTKYIS